MHPSTGRYERTTSALSTTVGQDTRPEIKTGREIEAERGESSETGGSVIGSTVGLAEERDTGLNNAIIGGHAERIYSREEIGGITEAMGRLED